jgi:hypothetical protein
LQTMGTPTAQWVLRNVPDWSLEVLLWTPAVPLTKK